MATLEEADNTAEMDTAIDRPSRPSPESRKSSFSDALGKLASNSFSRRRTVANIQVSNQAPSRLPIASGIARSTSFSSSVNGLSSKTNATGSGLVTSSSLAFFPSSGLHKIENQQPSSKSARLSTRIAQTPFFSRQASTPVTPQRSHLSRESSVQITQHHLMAPLGPPMPRRKTLGDVQTGSSSVTSSPRTPSYARTTSSSENRRKATLGALKENQILTPTPNHASKTTPSTLSSGKPRSGTPHPKRTPASTSSGPSSVPIRAAPKASETPTPTSADVPEPTSPGKARVSFSGADEILAPITADPRKPQVERDIEEPETPTPTPGDFLNQKIATLRRDLEEARLASTTENLAPAKAAVEEDVAEEAESRSATPIPQNPRHIFTAMPSGYWGGRVMALSDRFRTEEMHDSSSIFRVGGMHDDVRRNRRVFVHLNSLCQTDAAKASLAAFKSAYEKRMEDEDDMEGGKVVKGKGKAKVEAVGADEGDDEDGEVAVVLPEKKKGGLFGKLGKTGKKGRKKSAGW